MFHFLRYALTTGVLLAMSVACSDTLPAGIDSVSKPPEVASAPSPTNPEGSPSSDSPGSQSNTPDKVPERPPEQPSEPEVPEVPPPTTETVPGTSGPPQPHSSPRSPTAWFELHAGGNEVIGHECDPNYDEYFDEDALSDMSMRSWWSLSCGSVTWIAAPTNGFDNKQLTVHFDTHDAGDACSVKPRVSHRHFRYPPEAPYRSGTQWSLYLSAYCDTQNYSPTRAEWMSFWSHYDGLWFRCTVDGNCREASL